MEEESSTGCFNIVTEIDNEGGSMASMASAFGKKNRRKNDMDRIDL